jgi:uncharacterized protein (TIRG00374 family)
MFYGSVTPGYSGQLMRVPYMKEVTNEPYGKLFVNSLIETFVHTFSMYGMIIVGAFLVFSSIPDLLPLALLWIIIFSSVLFFFLKKERGEALFHALIRFFIPKSLKGNLARFVDTFYNEFPKVRNLILPLVIGISTWIIIFSQEYLIVFGMDVDIPYLHFLLLFPVANAAGFLPISPGGLGTRELVSVFLFSTLFGIADADILIFTLIGFVVTDIFTGFIGMIVALLDTTVPKKRLLPVD